MDFIKGLHLLCLFAVLPSHGSLQNNITENVTVNEGHILSLRCVGSADGNASLQWSNPRGFSIFFNNEKVLHDRRYELTHYSPQELTITLSNVSVADEGIYRCLYYSNPLRTTIVNVTVLAAPSSPALEIIIHNQQKRMVLSCTTWGSKPPPTITWLIDNSFEVYGDTTYNFERNGKKCNTTSTLTVRSYSEHSVAECVIHHESLGSSVLIAPFKFTDVLTFSGEDGMDSSTDGSGSFLEEAERTEPAPKYLTLTTDAFTERELPLSTGPGTSTTMTAPVNGTEPSQTMATLGQDNVTEMYQKDGRNKNGILLVILVIFLIFTLLFIVHLFIMKLRKAHQAWKKESEASDQTVESNKSRSNNEEPPGQDRNLPGTNGKPEIFYVKECSEIVLENLNEMGHSQYRTLDQVPETRL
ncbi:cytotoxic and regulatory T-cell molecule [Lissotriton helveticus]